MLKIIVPGCELFDEETGRVFKSKDHVLCLEHSLLSLSKWESKWHKPFLESTKGNMSNEEILDYIRCMTISQNEDISVYADLTKENIEEIRAYMDNPMTASWFNEKHNPKHNSKVVTSELIYYWMIALQIPFNPCEKWHLNRLLTLIRICNVENAPKKKMRKADVMRQNAMLNEQRKKMLGSAG